MNNRISLRPFGSWACLLWALLHNTVYGQSLAGSVNPTPGTQNYYETVNYQGDSRDVLIIQPDPLPLRAMPAIIMLHYDGGTPELQANLARAGSLAQQGYVVILPPGIDGHWSDDPDDPLDSTDDVGFLSRLISTMSVGVPNIDPKRIAMAGFSNGGFMSERMACERPDLIAAAFLVAASMRISLSQTCDPSRPVPIAFVVGTDDPLVPYDGADTPLSRTSFLSAADTMSLWLNEHGCRPWQTQSADLPIVVNDGTSVTQALNDQCSSGGAVELFTVYGGGHAWPDGLYTSIGADYGTISRNFDTTAMLADFAGRWSTDSTSSATSKRR